MYIYNMYIYIYSYIYMNIYICIVSIDCNSIVTIVAKVEKQPTEGPEGLGFASSPNRNHTPVLHSGILMDVPFKKYATMEPRVDEVQ